MTHKSARRSTLSRYLAALVLAGIYCFSLIGTSALLVGASTTSAFARGGGRGGGRGVGRGGGRGRGGGVVIRGGGRGYGRGRGRGCYWSPIYGRTICPY